MAKTTLETARASYGVPTVPGCIGCETRLVCPEHDVVQDPDQRECNQCGWKDDAEWRDPAKGRWQCGRYPYGSCDGVMVPVPRG